MNPLLPKLLGSADSSSPITSGVFSKGYVALVNDCLRGLSGRKGGGKKNIDVDTRAHTNTQTHTHQFLFHVECAIRLKCLFSSFVPL